jgi:hypothetical protein
MKMLISLVVLINLLGFLMLTNIPDRSAAVDNSVDQNRFRDQNSLLLLSELSAQELLALLEKQKSDYKTEQEPDSESDSGSLDSLESSDLEQCEVVGPFVDRNEATAALGVLLPEVSAMDKLIISSRASEFWLKLPLPQSLDIAPALWGHFQAKKRYLEDCMKVANRLEFH